MILTEENSWTYYEYGWVEYFRSGLNLDEFRFLTE